MQKSFRDAMASKVLLVDDDPIMRELAATKLVEAGYSAATAENGAEALTAMRADPVDLVIADIDMPVMDGYHLTHEIRRDKALSQTPVIVITSSDHAEAVERAFAAGATSFLAKPINWTLFANAVQFVLRASEDQKQLRLARDQAEAGARFKDSLMSMMSHELRTPLNAIIGFGQLLGGVFETENDVMHKQYADYIIDGGRRLLGTVSDILLASDAASGALRIADDDCMLGDLLESAADEMRPDFEKRKATLSVVVDEPTIELCCDCGLVRRAIAKLIENSLKFSEDGVEVLIAATLLENGDLALVVKDDGPGFDDQRIKIAMEPFTQSDMSLKRSQEGLGIGLPLVNAIVSAHGGQFRLLSKKGAGAQAIMVFPKSRIRARAPQERRVMAG